MLLILGGVYSAQDSFDAGHDSVYQVALSVVDTLDSILLVANSCELRNLAFGL